MRGPGRLGAFLLFAMAAAAQPAAQLPPGERWLSHLNDELLPFWTTEAAIGSPIGAFPSTRCDDGTLYHDSNPCPEIKRNSWISPTDRYLVPLSRQTYGYGVAFHLTGDPKYLALMKAGVDYIRQNAIDRDNGGMFEDLNLKTGEWGPRAALRDPQQLGYGLLGLAFYYYLTRDADVLPDILAIKDYIFANYYNATLGALQWQLEPNSAAKWDSLQLVAQLDQMNTYLVLLTPLLPEPYQSEWKQTLSQVAHIIVDKFYSPSDQLLFLSADTPPSLATQGTDFGHNAKGLWMIRFAGQVSGEQELVDFAETNAKSVLERSYIESCGCWAEGLSQGGALDSNKSWWIYDELDQLAATLALSDASYAEHLPQTYDYWFRYFVDPDYGEVWNAVDGATNAPIRDLPKSWQWKSAYHDFEHALVGYIAAQQLQGLPVTLYFAFSNPPDSSTIQPYYFHGSIGGMESFDYGDAGVVWAVSFTDVR